MEDFNRLKVTTAQPDARPVMQGTQGQKPRKMKKAEREQARREEAERKKAEHDQNLQDMIERQRAGKKPKKQQKSKKSQLQQAGKEMQNVARAAGEIDPAQSSKLPVAQTVPGLAHAAAKTGTAAHAPGSSIGEETHDRKRSAVGRMKPEQSAQFAKFSAPEERHGLDVAADEVGTSAQTSKFSAVELKGQKRLADGTIKAAQSPKLPTGTKVQGQSRVAAGATNKVAKFPAANQVRDQSKTGIAPADAQWMSKVPSAAVSNSAILKSSGGEGRLRLNKEALLQLGTSERPYQEIDVWAKNTAKMAFNNPNPGEEVMESIEWDDNQDPSLIDCTTAPRQYVRIQGNNFPIWKPSDRDGADIGTGDIFGGTLPPTEERWKVFQTDIGDYDWKDGNIPPKFTRLDDLAVHLVLTSNIPKGKIGTFWPHDFAGTGKVRRQRSRVGRPAIKDATATGNDKYHHTILGGQGVAPYYFTGTADFQPIRYRLLPRAPDPSEAELSAAAKAKRRIEFMLDQEEAENPNRRAHGHNQYTPRDMLVKHGAPSFAKPVEKSHGLPRLPRPDLMITGPYNPIHTEWALVGGIAESAHESVVAEKKKAHLKELSEATVEELENELKSRSGGGLLDDDEDEEDDLAELIKRPKRPTLPKPSLLDLPPADDDDDDDGEAERPVSRRAFKVPRVLGMVDRLDLERQIKDHVLAGNPSKAAMAEEFAREHVRAEQLGKEVKHLQEQIPEAEEDEDDNF